MNHPIVDYLRDVLGIEAFVRPEGAMAGDQPFGGNVTETGTDTVTVLVDGQVTASGRDLITKMLAAIDVHSFNLVALADAPNLIEFSKNQAGRFVIGFGVKNPESADSGVGPVHWLELLPINKYLEGKDAALLRDRKKTAWNQLQKLKQDMGT